MPCHTDGLQACVVLVHLLMTLRRVYRGPFTAGYKLMVVFGGVLEVMFLPAVSRRLPSVGDGGHLRAHTGGVRRPARRALGGAGGGAAAPRSDASRRATVCDLRCVRQRGRAGAPPWAELLQHPSGQWRQRRCAKRRRDLTAGPLIAMFWQHS